MYIGSSVRLSIRFHQHIKGAQSNIKLQNAIKKYTLEDFIFVVFEYCDSKQLLNREQFYLDTLNPLYNINPSAGSLLGYKHTEEVIARMKGRTHSEEAKAKMSKIQQTIDRSGENNPRGMLGKTHSAETKAKMQGRLVSLEAKAKMGAAKVENLHASKKVFIP